MRFRRHHAIAVAALSFAGLMFTSTSASAEVVCDLRTNTTCPAVNGGFFSKTDPTLTISGPGTRTIDGTVYREFFLDVNEQAVTNGSGNYITLDQLEIFTSNTPSLTSYSNGGMTNSGATGALAGATKIYDLDNGGDNYVQIHYLVQGNGSGSSAVTFYLPDSLFTGQYIYLFSQFGTINEDSMKWASEAGFEEINTAIPEPASLLLLGTGLLVAWRRRRLTLRG